MFVDPIFGGPPLVLHTSYAKGTYQHSCDKCLVRWQANEHKSPCWFCGEVHVIPGIYPELEVEYDNL